MIEERHFVIETICRAISPYRGTVLAEDSLGPADIVSFVEYIPELGRTRGISAFPHLKLFLSQCLDVVNWVMHLEDLRSGLLINFSAEIGPERLRTIHLHQKRQLLHDCLSHLNLPRGENSNPLARSLSDNVGGTVLPVVLPIRFLAVPPTVGNLLTDTTDQFTRVNFTSLTRNLYFSLKTTTF